MKDQRTISDELLAEFTDRLWNASLDGGPVEFRIQADSGSVILHIGDAQYDTDHSGHWGAGSIEPPCDAREAILDAWEQVLESEELAV